jgi:hypothetical protein
MPTAQFFTDDTRAVPIGAEFVPNNGWTNPNVMTPDKPVLTSGVYFYVPSGEYGLAGEIEIEAFYPAIEATGSFSVRLGEVECVVTEMTNDSITCTIPAQEPAVAVGKVDVVVNNSAETASLVKGFKFTDGEPELSLEVNDDVNFVVTPRGGIGSGYTVATVDTNYPNGYTLSMEADGSDLVCGSNAGWTIPSVSSDGSLSNDTWGYGLGSFDPLANAGAGAWNPPSTNNWKIIPVGTADVLANQALPSAAGGDKYGIYFGAKVSFNTPPCANYTQTLIITVIANP